MGRRSLFTVGVILITELYYSTLDAEGNVYRAELVLVTLEPGAL